MNTVYRAWHRARKAALSPEQFESVLAQRPYDLPHACLSTWLNADVAPVQVVEWAGHSVAVLLSVYAKCFDGQEVAAMLQIENALNAENLRDQNLRSRHYFPTYSPQRPVPPYFDG